MKKMGYMLDVVKVASYISRRYEREYGSPIDEMKLHKLLYFAQRESLIQIDQPLSKPHSKHGNMGRFSFR